MFYRNKCIICVYCRGEWGGDNYLRKFVNIFIWNWFFSQISYRDTELQTHTVTEIQYRIIALKKIIKTSIKLIKFLFIDIKKYSSFDRCNLPVWGQGDQVIDGDNRGEIVTITSILISEDISVADHDNYFQ